MTMCSPIVLCIYIYGSVLHVFARIPKPFDNKPSHSTCCHLAIGSGTNILISNNVRMSKATEMCLRDHNSNNCTHSGNVCYCTYMVNDDYDKFR